MHVCKYIYLHVLINNYISCGFSFVKFVLKHKEFAYLRETENFTNSVCPNNKGKFIYRHFSVDPFDTQYIKFF